MKVVRGATMDIHRNLAVEEALLPVAGREPVLFLCRNAPAVVIGKNQNPWRECAVGEVEAGRMTLARRISGGGAVYHDPGNLNYSVLLPRVRYRRDEVFRVVLGVLAGLGVEAEVGVNQGLFHRGRKFSGSAFCFRGGAVIHHGTLLLSADLGRLEAALRPALPGLATRAIPSVRSPVLNLAEAFPGLNDGRIANGLISGFSSFFDQKAVDFSENDLETDKILQKSASDAWVWDYTPGFEIRLSGGGEVVVEEGRVVKATGEGVDSAWVGRSFRGIWRQVAPKVGVDIGDGGC